MVYNWLETSSPLWLFSSLREKGSERNIWGLWCFSKTTDGRRWWSIKSQQFNLGWVKTQVSKKPVIDQIQIWAIFHSNFKRTGGLKSFMVNLGFLWTENNQVTALKRRLIQSWSDWSFPCTLVREITPSLFLNPPEEEPVTWQGV